VAGRSSEAGSISYTQMEWDYTFLCVLVDISQTKTGKTKKAVFCAGERASCCWFLDWADYLCTHRREVYDELNARGCWLLDHLSSSKSSGGLIGKIIKELAPVVPIVPEGANASSIRAGVANAAYAYCTAEQVQLTMGHQGATALAQYIDSTAAALMPCAVVTSGWPPLPYGQRGACGKPADFSVMVNLHDEETIDRVMDFVFLINIMTTPPQLRHGGRLRPALRAAFASLVMYYPQRWQKLATTVCEQLRTALASTMHIDKNAAHRLLLDSWSPALNTKFKVDNLCLTARTADTGVAQLTEALQRLGAQFAASEASRVAEQQQQAAKLTAQFAALLGGFVKLAVHLETVVGSGVSSSPSVPTFVSPEPQYPSGSPLPASSPAGAGWNSGRKRSASASPAAPASAPPAAPASASPAALASASPAAPASAPPAAPASASPAAPASASPAALASASPAALASASPAALASEQQFQQMLLPASGSADTGAPLASGTSQPMELECNWLGFVSPVT
jgi:hypothetical protein